MNTIAFLTFEYKGKQYEVEYDFEEDYPLDTARWMFEQGNYSCDDNRSIFIQEKYPEFPLHGCGDQIKLVKAEYKQVPVGENLSEV
jgi:hypothetical protein